MIIIIRPHRSTTYVDAAYCYRQSSVVCRSVCRSVCRYVTPVSPANAKTAEPIEMPFRLWTRLNLPMSGPFDTNVAHSLARNSFLLHVPLFIDALLWIQRWSAILEQCSEETENCFSERESPKFVRARSAKQSPNTSKSGLVCIILCYTHVYCFILNLISS